MKLRGLVLVGLVYTLSGCSWLTFGLMGNDGPEEITAKGPTLGKLVGSLPQLNLPAAAEYKPDRAEVMAAYNRVYGMLPSMQENHAVGKRLADLHMDVGQDEDIEGAENPYQPAVSLYETLLSSAQGSEDLDAIIYQLARAYDLTGQTDKTLSYLDRLISQHPHSEFVPEGRFRRAEIRFSAEQYRDASSDYGYVVALGDTTPYYRNASYMLGWSEFKRSRFDQGLVQFFNVLDDLLGDEERRISDVAKLSKINEQLLEDSFRVVTLTLSYLDGAQTLADEMRKRGKPDWQYLAYQRLADDYFVKERYLDNVATWQTFIEHNSLDIRAPAAHQGMIKTLMDAGFPSDVLPKKKEYVVRYGVYSEFWAAHPDGVRDGYLPTLHLYLSELAKLAHADAQDYDKLLQDKKTKRKHRVSERTALFLAAAQWYEEMIVTFPEDPRTAEYLFLLGESYTEAVEPGRAVAAYQRVVRDFPEYPQAHEAGYAAIIGLSELVETAPADEHELWQRLKIDAQIEFALLFAGDPRAPSVQTDAADTLFSLGHTAQALDLAENLLQEWPSVDFALRKTALLIIGHGRFENGEFVAAENAYHQLLAGPLDSVQRAKVDERLLASVYKQGELAELELNIDEAVGHYMRLAKLAPGSALAAQGHFDAIAAIEGAGQVAKAASLLADFRQIYPHHELGKDIDMRLAGMYEESQNLSAAAVEYVNLAQRAQDKDVRRQSLYRAAEIYLELEDVSLAIEHFRDYAHSYKQPLQQRLEAIHHLDLLYQRTGEGDKRRFWLAKKIDLYEDMGKGANERATFLAAQAQFLFAEDERAKFASIRLTHPLKRSLKKKQNALKKTLKSFERVAAYEVAQYTAASTFNIADLYSSLSKSIMSSDRPKGLSSMEMEQYDILLEEQAFPFEETSIEVHEVNLRRAWSGSYDEWVKLSFVELARLMPGRYRKPEREVTYAQAIH